MLLGFTANLPKNQLLEKQKNTSNLYTGQSATSFISRISVTAFKIMAILKASTEGETFGKHCAAALLVHIPRTATLSNDRQ